MVVNIVALQRESPEFNVRMVVSLHVLGDRKVMWKTNLVNKGMQDFHIHAHM